MKFLKYRLTTSNIGKVILGGVSLIGSILHFTRTRVNQREL